MRAAIGLALVALAFWSTASIAEAQAFRLGALPSPEAQHGQLGEDLRPSDLSPPSDPWYAQYYTPWAKDARQLIVERAQFQAQQRQLRIASRAWFGISASRPLTTADIMFGDRAAKWVSGSPTRPYHWSYVPPAVILYDVR